MKKFLIATCAALMLSVPVWANLITNGSFEDGAFTPTPWGWQTLAAPATAITGWVVAQGSVDYVGAYWQAAHGNRSLDLNGDGSPGVIWQILSTTPGQLYRVSFALAGNPDVQPRTSSVRVWVDDPASNYADFSFLVNGQTHQQMGWVYHEWFFTATASTTRLGFSSLDTFDGVAWGQNWGYSFGPALDDVTVEAVSGVHTPEPGAFVLALVGLAAVAVLKRRE